MNWALFIKIPLVLRLKVKQLLNAYET
jgi:hypothetical protein